MESLDDDKMRGRFSERFNSDESAAPSWDSFKSNLAPRRRRPAGYWFTGGLLILLAVLATYFKLFAPVTLTELAVKNPSSIQNQRNNTSVNVPASSSQVEGQVSEIEASSSKSGKDETSGLERSISSGDAQSKSVEATTSGTEINPATQAAPKTLENQTASLPEKESPMPKGANTPKNQKDIKVKSREPKAMANAMAGLAPSKPTKETMAVTGEGKTSQGKGLTNTKTLGGALLANSGSKPKASKRKSKGESLTEVAGPGIVKSRVKKGDNRKGETQTSNPKDLQPETAGTAIAENLPNKELPTVNEPIQPQVVIAKPADTTLAVKKSKADSLAAQKKELMPSQEASKRSRFSLWAQATYSGQNIRIANSYSDRLVQISHQDRLSAKRLALAMGGGYKILTSDRWSLTALLGVRFWQTEFTAIRETRSSTIGNASGNDTVVTYSPAISHSIPQTTIHRSAGLLSGLVVERKISGPWSLLAEANVLNNFTLEASGPANVRNFTSAGIRPALQYKTGQWDWSVGLEWFMPIKGPATGQAIIGNNGVGIRAVRYFKK